MTQKHFVLSVLVGLGLTLTGCAHNQTDGSDSVKVNEAEDKAILSLPAPKNGDLDSSQNLALTIPTDINGEVEQWIEYFQGRGRGYFERYMERGARYIPIMKKVLKDNGVPEDLVYIAMIESGFTAKIKSRAKAVGFWQFIGGTGRHYNLKVTNLIDERYDPVRSTEAAAAYFKGLYNLFNDWFLAIASYNVGENRIKNLVMKNYTRSFWELARKKKLPIETTHYIPKFLAARMIAREPEKYGFIGLKYQEPMVFDTITSDKAVDLRKLASNLKVDYQELKDLNPSCKTQYVPVVRDVCSVRVPQGSGDAAKQALNDVTVKDPRYVVKTEHAAGDDTNFMRYKVRRGDTLSEIANRFDVSVSEIMRVNNFSSPKRMRAGKYIRIPSSAFNVTKEKRSVVTNRLPAKTSVAEAGSATSASAGAAQSVASTATSSVGAGVVSTTSGANSSIRKSIEQTIYRVRRGDTLSRIAHHHRVALNDLLASNNFTLQTKVRRGQKIVIPTKDD